MRSRPAPAGIHRVDLCTILDLCCLVDSRSWLDLCWLVDPHWWIILYYRYRC